MTVCLQISGPALAVPVYPGVIQAAPPEGSVKIFGSFMCRRIEVLFRDHLRPHVTFGGGYQKAILMSILQDKVRLLRVQAFPLRLLPSGV
ncbi:MAG: hypothetical protein C4582_04720 [Desulfobacteraceae bacterium]|jgi:hypothetical protein|nr:MAG: hypothetical protein C4582_04720 [Desulfobacteraceae bacterium]